MTNQLQALDQAQQTLMDVGIRFGPKVLAALVILVAGLFVARWVGGIGARWLGKLELDQPVRDLLLRLLRGTVLVLFLLLALQNLDVELLPLLAGIGVAGAGLALAAQGVLSNLFAGLTIIFTKPFRVGEYVSMAGVEGCVEEIGMFNTRLSNLDRSNIFVPNRLIVGEILHNYGTMRQIDVIVGVAYDTDLNAAFTAVNEMLVRNARVLKDPAPMVRIALLGESSIDIEVKPWVGVLDFHSARSEIYHAIVEEFRLRHISIPFPQREVRMLGAAA